MFLTNCSVCSALLQSSGLVVSVPVFATAVGKRKVSSSSSKNRPRKGTSSHRLVTGDHPVTKHRETLFQCSFDETGETGEISKRMTVQKDNGQEYNLV